MEERLNASGIGVKPWGLGGCGRVYVFSERALAGVAAAVAVAEFAIEKGATSLAALGATFPTLSLLSWSWDPRAWRRDLEVPHAETQCCRRAPHARTPSGSW